jgi:hypothetical protein
MTEMCIGPYKVLFVVREESRTREKERTSREDAKELSQNMRDIGCRLVELEIGVKVPDIRYDVDG